MMTQTLQLTGFVGLPMARYARCGLPDPYGLQVTWATLVAISRTKALDV